MRLTWDQAREAEQVGQAELVWLCRWWNLSGKGAGDGFINGGVEIGGSDQDGIVNGGTGAGVMMRGMWR